MFSLVLAEIPKADDPFLLFSTGITNTDIKRQDPGKDSEGKPKIHGSKAADYHQPPGLNPSSANNFCRIPNICIPAFGWPSVRHQQSPDVKSQP